VKNQITVPKNQEGYVTIQGQKSDCGYALKCQEKNHKNQCLVVTGFGENMEQLSLETVWFERAKLTPATRFSAMPNEDGADGYCNSDRYIRDYFAEKKSMNSLPSFPLWLSLQLLRR